MKSVNAPVDVEAGKGIPRRIYWNRRTYVTRRLLDFWILQSRWWGDEEKRVYMLLETDRGVLEIYRVKKTSGRETRRSKRAARPFSYPMEGNTHTRELRQTESPYRPDARAVARRRFGLENAGASQDAAENTAENPAQNTAENPAQNTAQNVPRNAAERTDGDASWILSRIFD